MIYFQTYQIAEHKEELQNNDELLFELVSRLIQMVRESPKYYENMDALKCLAEIGPIKMKHISYYFLTDYESIQPVQQYNNNDNNKNIFDLV